MDIIYKYRIWILGITLILNILVCVIFNYTSNPTEGIMGLMLYLLPLLCIQILITIVGYMCRDNFLISRISVFLSILVLIISIFFAIVIK